MPDPSAAALPADPLKWCWSSILWLQWKSHQKCGKWRIPTFTITTIHQTQGCRQTRTWISFVEQITCKELYSKTSWWRRSVENDLNWVICSIWHLVNMTVLVIFFFLQNQNTKQTRTIWCWTLQYMSELNSYRWNTLTHLHTGLSWSHASLFHWPESGKNTKQKNIRETDTRLRCAGFVSVCLWGSLILMMPWKREFNAQIQNIQ